MAEEYIDEQVALDDREGMEQETIEKILLLMVRLFQKENFI